MLACFAILIGLHGIPSSGWYAHANMTARTGRIFCYSCTFLHPRHIERLTNYTTVRVSIPPIVYRRLLLLIHEIFLLCRPPSSFLGGSPLSTFLFPLDIPFCHMFATSPSVKLTLIHTIPYLQTRGHQHLRHAGTHND